MNEALTRWLLLPAHERLRGRETLSYYRFLRRSERRDAGALEALRLRKLRALVEHCLARVPFYRDYLHRAGVADAGEVDLDTLRQLPPLDRDEIRENLPQLCTNGKPDGLIRYSTGGSTGKPLVFYTDRVKEARHNAHKLRYRSWHGVCLGDRQVDFWGSPIELNRQTKFRVWKDRWLLNLRLLPARDLTEARLDAYADVLRQYRPRLIYGYPTVIYRVAAHIRDTATDFAGWRPRLIACTAEVLPGYQRAAIEQVFKAPVANEYGARDAGSIAHECCRGSLHVAAEHVLLDVNNPDGEGYGDLLVTNLDAFGMPFLRYRVGDRARISSTACGCGLSLPVMDQLVGRTNDFLVGRGGKLIHNSAVDYVLRQRSEFRQYKVRQRADCSLVVELITMSAEMIEEELAEIRTKLRRIMDLDVVVDFRFPTTIEPERSGKYRWLVSEAVDRQQRSIGGLP